MFWSWTRTMSIIHPTLTFIALFYSTIFRFRFHCWASSRDLLSADSNSSLSGSNHARMQAFAAMGENDVHLFIQSESIGITWQTRVFDARTNVLLNRRALHSHKQHDMRIIWDEWIMKQANKCGEIVIHILLLAREGERWVTHPTDPNIAFCTYISLTWRDSLHEWWA